MVTHALASFSIPNPGSVRRRERHRARPGLGGRRQLLLHWGHHVSPQTSRAGDGEVVVEGHRVDGEAARQGAELGGAKLGITVSQNTAGRHSELRTVMTFGQIKGCVMLSMMIYER